MKIDTLRFPSQPGVCVSVESRFDASVPVINNGRLWHNARSDLAADQNLNGKERSCQCFSLVALVSGQKAAIFMNTVRSNIRRPEFVWERSALVIWGSCSQLRVRFHTTGGPF